MSPNLAMYTYGMIPSASDTAITEILKHGLQVPICGLQVPICGSAPRMSAPRSEQTTRAATIFVYTHKTIARCGCSSRRASSRAASKSSAFVFESIADYWDSTKIHQRPSIYLFCFLKNLKQTIPNSFFSPAEAWVCP